MAGRYVNEDTVESERPLKVCAEAGRKCVRNIHQYPVLSAEWIALVDSLKQLSRLVQLEGRMPVNPKVLEAQGRDMDSEGTLWDQETHENAIRILVEEAKVNLCLRMMYDFKRWQQNPAERQATIEEAIKAYDSTEMQLDQKCIQFEECLGTLLRKAFMHVETLQLMDIPLLIEHCVFILQACFSTLGDSLGEARLQESVVLYYFSSLMKHAEALNNSELLARSREFQLVELAVSHFLRFAEQFPEDLKYSLAEGLAAMADNEDFMTEWESFFPSPDAKATFLMLQEKLTAPILEEKPEKRREIRPLLDFFNAIKRSMHLACMEGNIFCSSEGQRLVTARIVKAGKAAGIVHRRFAVWPRRRSAVFESGSLPKNRPGTCQDVIELRCCQIG
ncbi:unnamed protein product [Symbiodinium sp. CCMP2592]|nr:unnamed protein product [Symbiodinium sp. CCMP2592]